MLSCKTLFASKTLFATSFKWEVVSAVQFLGGIQGKKKVFKGRVTGQNANAKNILQTVSPSDNQFKYLEFFTVATTGRSVCGWM